MIVKNPAIPNKKSWFRGFLSRLKVFFSAPPLELYLLALVIVLSVWVTTIERASLEIGQPIIDPQGELYLLPVEYKNGSGIMYFNSIENMRAFIALKEVKVK